MQTHVFYCIFHNIIVSMLNVAQKWGRWFAFEVRVSLPLKFERLKYWTYNTAQIFIAMLILTYILMIGRIKLNGMTDKLIRLKCRSILVIRTYFNFYRKLPFCLCLFYRKKVFYIRYSSDFGMVKFQDIKLHKSYVLCPGMAHI